MSQETTRKAVVSYAIGDLPITKIHQIRNGLEECAYELLALGWDAEQVARVYEQIANDVESGDYS